MQSQQYESVVDDEMVATERELAEDAQWKRIQQNTFTRWANEHLRMANKTLGNLETDLSDGLRLIALIEVLSGKQLPKHNKRPTFRSQKLENVSVALKFLEDVECIKIVNIDSSDIVDCKLKLILGLIWMLILHYSISMPVWDGDFNIEQNETEKGSTPKQRLLNWIQSKVSDLPISNFTTDWNDGKAVGALVDAVAPGLCPDWQDWKSQNALQNATEAMALADDWLDVRQLIKPEELVSPNMDEMSMMTYLSQYPNAKLKEDAPLRPRTNPSRVRAYGPGIEPMGNVTRAPAKFTVETFSAGSGEVTAQVENPRGQLEPIELKYNNDKSKTYSASYIPSLEGTHKVSVFFAGKEIPKSPFIVLVEGTAGDASKVSVSGPGLLPEGNMVNKMTYFDIFAKDCGHGNAEVVIVDTAGQRNALPIKLYPIGDDAWRCEYIPCATGPININVFFANQAIPHSPFTVRINPISDSKKVRLSGRGLQPHGIRVGDAAEFKIYAERAGKGLPEVRIVGPGNVEEIATIRKGENESYDVTYCPKMQGRHTIAVFFAGQQVPRSPFEVNVGPYKESSIRAFGPGLIGGVVNYPASFTVQSHGETGALGFSIEGPSQAKIECDDNGDSSADIKYYPTVPGEYAVHVLCDSEDIPNSPFIAQILPKTDYFPEKVKCRGNGLVGKNLSVNTVTDFVVDTSDAGEAPLDIKILDSDCKEVPVLVEESSKGNYNCQYMPKSGKKHTIQVNYGGVATPNSPYKVNILQPLRPDKVQIFGPGIESTVRPNIPTHFTVDCSEAGEGIVELHLISDGGREVPLEVDEKENGSYLVDYCLPSGGNYTLTCTYGGIPASQSPININIPSKVDVSNIRVSGLQTSVKVNSPNEFLVDAHELADRDNSSNVTCSIINASGKKVHCGIRTLSDGVYHIQYIPDEEGPLTIDVRYDGLLVPGFPFTTNAQKVTDSTKCKAFGPGIEKAVVDKLNAFTVETKGAGSGGLGVAIEGPSEAKMTCKDNRDGSCTVEYVPTQVGVYDVSIKFADEHIPGSPFEVEAEHVVDVNSVFVEGKCLEDETCRAEVPLTFKVDASRVGKAPIEVAVKSNKGSIDNKPEVYDNRDGTYDVSFIPKVEGAILTIDVLYNRMPIPNSPFEVKVLPKVEPDKVKVISPTATSKGGILASLPVDFIIDASEAGPGHLDVQVLGPDSQPRKTSIIDNGADIYNVQFVPDDCGLYTVPIFYAGSPIKQSPLKIQAYATGSANNCIMTPIHENAIIARQQCRIQVDAYKAGVGKVTCKIKSVTGKEIDAKVDDNGDGSYAIVFTLPGPGEYTMATKFGGQPIPGGLSTFTIPEEKGEEEEDRIQRKFISAESNYYSNGFAELSSSYNPVHLHNIPVPVPGGTVEAEIKMPSGKRDKPQVVDNHDGTVSVKYEPREEGLHELMLKYNGEHIQGSPFKFHVDSISSGYVTAYGSGLTHAVSGEPANFTISTKGAGAGGLSLAVEGPSKAEISCHDNKDGTVSVSYLPTAPGEYKITVKFGDKHIKGSPFASKVTGEGRKRNQISVGSCSEVSLPGKVTDADTRLLNASIQAPSGLEEPCFLKKLPSGNLGISFTPREVGEHVVSVKRMGKHIVNSPFKISVGEREVGDAKKVKVSGTGLKEGKTHVENYFSVDTKNAGYGGLSLSIEGPSKAEIQCKDNEDGTLKICYKPSEPGYYIVNLKFADHHVDGSPFTVKVSGEGSNRQREKIERQRDAVPVTEVGSRCKLTFKMPGITTLDLSATVSSPSGISEDAVINEVEDGLYAVHFVPKELGVHTVSVKYKDIHIPGSPFQFTVGPLRDGGAHRVHAGGPGLERGEQGQPCEFNVWTREAGAGALAISVEGPSKADIDFKDRRDGSCYVSYVVSEPGEYRVGIKFNDQHIPDSPYKLFISPAMGDAHKLEVAQFPVSGVQADKPAQFIVQKNGAKGELDGKIVSPSGIEDDCFIQSIDQEQYSVRFMPRENGIHNIHVKFNGVHILGSPFRIKVGKDDADPAAVHVTGNGLTAVKTGQKTDFIVDTCNAGAGTLAVTIDGPSKVSMDCTEVEEGYKVRYTPLVPGDYYISLKYNGYHIVGSPFKVPCAGEDLAERGAQETSSVVVETALKTSKSKAITPVLPHFKSDASKVTSKGAGLKKAYLGKQNMFTVSAGDAGNNILFVGLHGPKGPCEEVFIKHNGRNNYTVHYLVKERGEYIIIVKWGDDHIPGSPFKVEV